MFFLAGLLGMMALGSVAIITTASSDDPIEDEDTDLAPAHDPVSDLDGPLLLTDALSAADLAKADPSSEPGDAEGSLFSRMGVINQTSGAEGFDDPVKAEEAAWLAGTPDDDQDYDILEKDSDVDADLPAVTQGILAGLDSGADIALEADEPSIFSDTLFGGWEDDLPDPVDVIDPDSAQDRFDLTGIAEDEQVIIVYDDSPDAPEPNVVVRPHALDPDRTEIVLNDLVVSTVPTQDAPAPEALALVGESLLKELALETA